jgi:hypothetical protein
LPAAGGLQAELALFEIGQSKMKLLYHKKSSEANENIRLRSDTSITVLFRLQCRRYDANDIS